MSCAGERHNTKTSSTERDRLHLKTCPENRQGDGLVMPQRNQAKGEKEALGDERCAWPGYKKSDLL